MEVVFWIDGAYEQVGDQTDHQQSGHQVHRKVVRLGFRHAGFYSRGGDVVDEAGTDERRDGPCRDETSVDRAHLFGSKDVA